MAAKQQLSRRDHRLLGVSPGTVGVEFRWKALIFAMVIALIRFEG
jgi:hypothetical protein